MLRIHQLMLDEDNLNKEHNLVGILLEIGDEKILHKEERDVTMQMLKIGDPISKKILNVILWNRQALVDK
jgi:hypothetical protein